MVGASKPNSAPATMATKIHAVRERRCRAKAASSKMAMQRRAIPAPCGMAPLTRPSVIPAARKSIAASNNTCSSFVLFIKCEGYQSSKQTTHPARQLQALIALFSWLDTLCFVCFFCVFAAFLVLPLTAQTSPGSGSSASGLDLLSQSSSVVSPLAQPTVSPGALLLLELDGRFEKAVAAGWGQGLRGMARRRCRDVE